MPLANQYLCTLARRAIALAIAENLLISKLESSVTQNQDSVTAQEVIAIGVSGFTSLTSSPAVLHALRQAYSESVRYTFILAVAGAVFAFFPACGMENVNIRHIAEERERIKKQTEAEAGIEVVGATEAAAKE